MRANAVEAVLGGRGIGDKTDLTEYVQGLAAAGLAVVMVEPMGKPPLDLRSAADKRTDNVAAQVTAKAAGNAEWARAKQPAGVHLATTDAARLAKYVATAEKRYGAGAVNLGVEVGRSRLVVIDADTAYAVDAFRKAYADNGGGEIAPTVDSPGRFDATVAVPFDPWVHKDGGHFWFTVPEGVTVPESGSYSVDGWTAYYADRQILIPPSVRPEGPYVWRGGVGELPEWLYAKIIERPEPRASAGGDSSNIDVWSASVPWAQVLTADGWSDSGRVSNCGCPEWTAPGPHDSHKSATAHEVTCTEGSYDASNGHAPLHVWTDNPPEGLRGGGTYSRIQFVANRHYGGDLGAAATALGIPEGVEVLGTGEPLEVATASTDPHDAALMAEVFGFSAVTAHVLEQARIRLVGPWAALFLALAHAALLTPWWVRLPAVVGSSGASLNSITALVGGSGAGKGAGSDGGMLVWDRDPTEDHGLIEAGQTVESALTAITVGSGQAFATLFRDWRKVTPVDKDGKKQREKLVHKLIRRTAWIDFAEIDTASSMMKSDSLQLSSELRRLWDGKQLGVHTKSVERRSELDPFTYRAVVTLGVQPERAGEMLAGEGGGLPQRLVWADTADYGRTIGGHRGERATMAIAAPAWGRTGDETVFMGVADSVAEQIITDREHVLVRSKDALTGIDAHRNLVRLKLAGAVAVLHSRADVTAEDWHLAGLLLTHSDRVRAEVQRVLAKSMRDAHESRGASDAYRDEGARKTRDQGVETGAASIHSWLSKRKGQAFTAAAIGRSGKPGQPRRIYCAEALAVLVDEGAVRQGPPARGGNDTYEWNADRWVES